MSSLKLQENKYYKTFLKEPWPYAVGAVILAVLNIAMFASTGKPWGVTTPFSYWGAWIYKSLGGNIDNWFYFQQPNHAEAIKAGFWNDLHSVSNLGIVFGALLSTLLASQFRIKKIKSFRQVIAAVLGGLLMGYGARLSFGCNIGALFSGIASMSLHGWVFMLFLFFGAWIGSKLLVKYFM